MSAQSLDRDLSKEDQLQMLRRMLTIRRFEERVAKEFEAGRVKGFVHLYIGEEGTAVGVCSALHGNDYITSTHRGHGHCIAKGVSVRNMMAELFAKRTGVCKGKGGSMHIADLSLGMLGANGIVGGGIPIATGAALSAKYRKSGQVAVAFFGDGALNQGSFHESLNLASMMKLPVLFVCENNQFAESTSVKYATPIADPTLRAGAYGMPGKRADGMDVIAVYHATLEAATKARSGEGPTLIVCDTYRFRGHYEGDDQTYRTNEQVEKWRENEPIQRLKRTMIKDGLLSEDAFASLDGGVLAEIEDAIGFAESSEWPRPDEALEDVYTSL